MRWLLIVFASISGSSDDPAPVPVEAFADQIVVSTTIEWSKAFRATNRSYRPPRVVVLQPPRGHPGGGSGYSGNLLVLDGRELDGIRSVFGRDGDTLAALVIAHEVAHHVQDQVESASAGGPGAPKMRELQADCAAGWWLGRTNTRARALGKQATYTMPDLNRALPQLLTTLAMLNGQVSERGVPAESLGHGNSQERTEAIMRGFGSDSPTTCGFPAVPQTH